MGVFHRAANGAHENTPWAYLGTGHRDDLLRRHIKQKEALRLDGLNRGRLIMTRTRHLDAHRRLVMLIIKNDIPRIRAALAVTERNGGGVFSFIRAVDAAAMRAYKPKSYLQSEYERAFLIWKLGGVFAANLAYRTLGLPSIDTTRRHITSKPLRASPGFPTVPEMVSNLHTAFENWSMPVCERHVLFHPASLSIDEIKIQERLRWEASTNMILGLCREHCSGFALEFRSMQQAELIDEGLKATPPCVHLATEVSISFVSRSQCCHRMILTDEPTYAGNCNGDVDSYRPPE